MNVGENPSNHTKYTCKICKLEKLEKEFYKRKDDGRINIYCIKCYRLYNIQKQREFKYKCIEYKGGHCSVCGYNKCFGALDFHHIKPNEKEFSINKIKSSRWEINKHKIIKELDKCVLLCSNCHRELHYLNNDSKIKEFQDKYNYNVNVFISER